MSTSVAPSALAQVPDSMRGQACLCPECAAGQSPHAPAFASAPPVPD